MAEKNYRGWSSGWSVDLNKSVVYDRLGNMVSEAEAAAYRAWKAQKKGPSAYQKDEARRAAVKTIRKESKELNRFRQKPSQVLKGDGKRNWNVPKTYSKYFHQSAFKRSGAGTSPKWSKNLTLKGGQTPNFNWERTQYTDLKGKVKLTGQKNLWGSNINAGGVGVLKNIAALLQQIQIAQRMVMVNSEHFRVMVGERAIQVFRNSFKYHKFYSMNSTPWHQLAEFTIRKREKRGTGSKILVEYRDLMDSFKLDKEIDPLTTRVSTDIVQASAGKHKKHSLCYAGWHNEGEGTYGNGWGRRRPKQYIKRQFMGHSTYLHPLTDRFMRKMMKTYLFDSVFRIPKA